MLRERAPHGARAYVRISVPVLAVIAVIYFCLKDPARGVYLTAVASALLVMVAVGVVAALRRGVRRQGPSLVEASRQTEHPTEVIPDEFESIREEVHSSLRSREYYERKLLPRMRRLGGQAVVGPVAGEGSGTEPRKSPRVPKPVRRAWELLSARRVGIGEIVTQIKKLEE